MTMSAREEILGRVRGATEDITTPPAAVSRTQVVATAEADSET